MISSYLVENKWIGVKPVKHGIFMFNRNDAFIGRSLDLYGEWCEPEILLLHGFIQDGDVVLDVGANIGTHSIPFSNMVGRSGRVHAFEPQRLAFQLLCGNIALNGIDNVYAYQKAVGGIDGAIHVPQLPPATEPFNFAAVPLSHTGSGDQAELITIDSLGLNACHLMKVDVEGMEADVLSGAHKTIQALQPVLFVENNTLDKAKPTIEAILALGYSAYWHISSYFHERNFFGNTENVFARYQPEANLLCLPSRSDFNTQGLLECAGADDNWRKAVDRIMRANRSAK